MSVNPVGSSQSPTLGGRPGETAGARQASFDAALAAFREEAAKSPAERARDEVLKKHSLSEEAYQRLPEQERAAIDREIVEAVRRTIRGPNGQSQARPFPG
jgi:hypothetical protein